MPVVNVTNKSSICYNLECGEKSLTPIYHRPDRSYKVAFYVCLSCSQFFEFIDWSTKRKMPYYNDMLGTVTIRLVKSLKDKDTDFLTRKNKVLRMQKENPIYCIQCSNSNNSKLYLRRKSKYPFIGYICKDCRTIYLVNRGDFKIKTLDPNRYLNGNYNYSQFIFAQEIVGQFAVAIGKPEPKDTIELNLKLPIQQIKKIKEFMRKAKIPIPLT